MKSSEEMTKEISELESQISSINERISDLQEKKALAENEHTRLIQDGLKSGELKDGSPGDLFERMLEHGLQTDALQKAKLDLEAQLAQAQAHLGLATLYESIVPAFKEGESNFVANLKAIEMGIDAVNEKMGALSESMDVFVRGAGNPLDLLEGLIKNPQLGGLSLKAFLDGQINEATGQTNDQFIQEVARKYFNIANKLPKLKSIEDTWMGLSDLLDSHARRAQNLVPSRLKYVPAPPIKPKQEHGTTLRIPPKRPDRLLSENERKAKEARRKTAGAGLRR